MKQAVYCSNFGAFGNPAALVSVAQAAEAAGWDGCFIYDHILWQPGEAIDSCDPWVALAAMAQATEKITLGPMITPLARRLPWEVAHQVVALDHLSGGGRFILGVGLGVDREYEAFGLGESPRERAARLDEVLVLLRELWSGERVQHDGHWHLNDVVFRPVPLGRIPIWVAGRYPNRRPAQRAARHDGIIPINTTWSLDDLLPPERLGEMKDLALDFRDDDADFEVVQIGVSPSDRDAARQLHDAYRDQGATWWLELFSPFDQGRSVSECLARIERGPVSAP